MGQFSMRLMLEATVVFALLLTTTIAVGKELAYLGAVFWVLTFLTMSLIGVVFGRGMTRAFAIGTLPTLAVGLYFLCFADLGFRSETVLSNAVSEIVSSRFFTSTSISSYGALLVLWAVVLPSFVNGLAAIYIFNRFQTLHEREPSTPESPSND